MACTELQNGLTVSACTLATSTVLFCEAVNKSITECVCAGPLPLSILHHALCLYHGGKLCTALQATLGHMFNTTEEAISSPVPSQDGSQTAYSPTARQESMQGFLPLPGHMAHQMPDLNSLYDSPAGGASEILVLEGRDGSHVNLTQSRFSRFASETSGSLNPFELTSRAFRSSGADQFPQLSKPYSASVQQALASTDRAPGLSLGSDQISTAYRQSSSVGADFTAHNAFRQSSGLSADGTAQNTFRQSSSIDADGTAQTAAALEAITTRQQQSRPQASYGSYESLRMSSQASARLPTMSRDEVSSYRQIQQQPQSSFNMSAAACQESEDCVNTHSEIVGSTNVTPESAPLGAVNQRYEDSPSSNYGGHALDSPKLQGSWAGLDDSVAGSVHSPGQESLHSYTASTPAKPAVGFEAGTPEHKRLASNFARLASAAALARSPGLAAAGPGAAVPSQLTSQLSNPEMRTPRTFFNPSFDSHHDAASP